MRLVLLALAVFLCGWSVSSTATIYSNGSAGATSWAFERMMSPIVSSTSAGLNVGGTGIARIGYAGKQIGSIAMTEASIIGFGDIAAVVARSFNPAVIALTVGMFAAEMAYKRCAESGTGWCKRAPANSSSSDDGFTGYQWCFAGGIGGGACGDSPGAACAAAVPLFPAGGYTYAGLGSGSGGYYYCRVKNASGEVSEYSSTVSQARTCVSGYIPGGSGCVPDPGAPASWLPATYPDIAAAWNKSAAANPSGVPDFWKAMTPDEQAQASQNAQRQPTQINGTDVAADPAAKTSTDTNTKPDGTSETCTTTTGVRVQARPNTSDTAGNSPLNFATTTTTTRSCPTTGTTTTVGNTDSGNTNAPPSTGGGTPPKVELKTCGLADTGPCKIDETGTPTAADAKTAMASPATDLQTAEKDAETSFTTANTGRQWSLSMPHVLPSGTCQPIEWFVWGSWRGSWDVCTQLQYVRDLLAWLWPVLAAVYVWNKAAGANAGVV